MPYCVKQDLIDALSDKAVSAFATDVTGEPQATIDARIDAVIVKSCDRVDGYLRGRCSLPLVNVPGIVKDLAVDIALYFLASRKGIREGTPEENLVRKYDEAIRYLKDIQAGKADIGLPDDEGASVPASGASVRSRHRIFNRHFWKGF